MLRYAIRLTSLFLLLGAVSCGSSDDGGDDASVDAGAAADTGSTADAAAATDAAVATDAAIDPSPGTITVRGENVTDADGKIMLFWALEPGSSGPFLAGGCAGVSGDPATVSGILSEIVGQNDPCDLGDPIEFEPGNYEINAGLYTPGMMTPDVCAVTIATVSTGDTTVLLPVFDTCP